MWDDVDLKCFEWAEKTTPELQELYNKLWDTKFLKRRLEDFRTAALITTSTEWTPEARQYVESIADGAAPAIKSLDDQIKVIELKIKAVEADLNGGG